ncbi:MAG: hypothetical protein CL470_09260 [Acidimicrobiaceae bacterium]|nr:hypothetical protein [Acidimicrobiaceae bacterium]|tara:strand:+ start:592 stop:1413 length:822 start_codon:yes stop_codon:yes gene_type:complete
MGQFMQAVIPKFHKLVAICKQPSLRLSVFFNAVTFGLLWLGYSAVRRVTSDSFQIAQENAVRVVDFQERIGLPSEVIFQKQIINVDWIVQTANVFYFVMHFPSMIIFLFWAMLRKREWMSRIRFALVTSTAIGLIIHLVFPLAPPRLTEIAGFVDTAKVFGPDPYKLGIAKAANQFAAMPSLHVGWALLLAMAVLSILKTRYRWLILLHPIITTIVVVVTANHWWLDIFVGAVLGWAGWIIAFKYRPLVKIDHHEELPDSENHIEELDAATRE